MQANARDHEVNIRWSELEPLYIARAAEMPGVMADGLTREAAAREIDAALQAIIEAAEVHGHPLPEPRRGAAKSLARQMNASIELHDSDLAAITYHGASVVLSFSPAYIHRSNGCPGSDAGTGWTQAATLTFSDATASAPTGLPLAVSNGWLRAGNVLHKGLIPVDSAFDRPCELHLVLCRDAAPLVVRGTHLTIALHGAPSSVEEVDVSASGTP